MSTVDEIKVAIAQLSPEDFRALEEWMAKRAVDRGGRMWTPEELTEGAKVAMAELDPAKADLLWREIVAGFSGDGETLTT